MASLDATLETYDSVVELRPLGSAMSVDFTGQPTHPPGAFYVLIDEAVTEVDEGGVAYTAYGFLCMWRGRQTGGYRRFQEFRSLASELSSEHRLPGIRFPLWPFCCIRNFCWERRIARNVTRRLEDSRFCEECSFFWNLWKN